MLKINKNTKHIKDALTYESLVDELMPYKIFSIKDFCEQRSFGIPVNSEYIADSCNVINEDNTYYFYLHSVHVMTDIMIHKKLTTLEDVNRCLGEVLVKHIYNAL